MIKLLIRINQSKAKLMLSFKIQDQEMMQPLLSKLLNQNRKYRYFVNVDYNIKWSG